MSFVLILKIVLALTVLGLFLWIFAVEKKVGNPDEETFKYGKYMIYLLVVEVAALIFFTFL